MEQGSAEWFAARCGKATGSKIHDIIAKTKTGYSATRKNYEALLIAERMTGEVADSFSNSAMEWGKEQEGNALEAYCFENDVEADLIGFVEHPTITMSGASPDALIGHDGLIEIKCPNTSTHIETLLGARIKANYNTQMQWQMACTGRKWCDFASYDPRLPAPLQLHVRRVPRDDALISDLEREVSEFLGNLSEKVEKLRALGGLEQAA